MANTPATQIWTARLLFLGLAFVIIVVQLLPLNTQPVTWAPPDLLLAITLAWVARRPDYLPVYVIAAIFLMADLLFQRPPGLWTALVIILTEAIRNRRSDIRNMPTGLEWGMVALGIVAITLANRLALLIVATPQAPLGLTMIQMTLTIMIYPVVVILAHVFFGVRRTAPGQVDSRGHRL